MAKALKQRKMVHYDKNSDVLYFGVRDEEEEEFIEVAPGISAELDAKKNVIGIEVLNASKILKPILLTPTH